MSQKEGCKRGEIPIRQTWGTECIDAQDIRELIKIVDEGKPILTAGKYAPRIPTIHEIKGAEHLGFGLFKAHLPGGGEVDFDAGGMMRRLNTLSYTTFRGDTQKWGYKLPQVKKELEGLLEKEIK